MAMALDGFCIREYVDKMRGIDGDKCWPFSEARSGRSLPPMPCRKFRWWANELPPATAGKAGAVIDVGKDGSYAAGLPTGSKRSLDAETTGAAAAVCLTVSGDGDPSSAEGRQEKVQTPTKGKQRTPKKRSIVELFAVSPQIKPVGSNMNRATRAREEHQEQEQGGKVSAAIRDSGSLERRRKRRDGEIKTRSRKKGEEKAKAKDESATDALRKGIGIQTKLMKKKKMNKKKKHKRPKVEICATEKEKFYNLRMPSPIDISNVVHKRLHDKNSGNMQKNLLNHQRKKPAAIGTLSKKHMLKLVRASKLISKNQVLGRLSRLHTVLKKRRKGMSANKGKAGALKGGDIVKLCRKSKKILKFPENVGTSGNNTKCLKLGLPNLQNLCRIISDVLAASSSVDNSCKHSQVSETAQLVNLSEKRIVTNNAEPVETLSEKQQLNGECSHVNINPPGRKRNSITESFDLNHPAEDSVDLDIVGLDTSVLKHCGSSSSKVLIPDDSAGDCGIQREHIISLASGHIYSPHNFGNYNFRSGMKSPLNFTGNTSLYNSTSCLSQNPDSNLRLCYLTVDAIKDGPNHFPGYLPAYCISHKGAITGSCSSVGPKSLEERELIPDLSSIHTEKNEGFVGLPLNSQGELIHLNPNVRFGYCELFKKPTLSNHRHMLPYSYHIEPHMKEKRDFACSSLSQKDPQNLFIKPYFPVRNSSDSSYSEMHALEIEGQNHIAQGHLSNYYPKQMQLTSRRSTDQLTENLFDRMKLNSGSHMDQQHIQPAVQQSMRLMGKNVTVSRSNKETQGCNEGKIWTDKEVISQNRPAFRLCSTPTLQRWSQDECIAPEEVGPSRDIPYQPLESTSRCKYLPSAELAYNCMHLDFGSQSVLKEGCYSTARNHGMHLDFSIGSVSSNSFLNKTSCPIPNSNLRTHFVDFELPNSYRASCSNDAYQHMLLNSNQCKHGQSISYNVLSASNPSFINKVPRSFCQTSIAQSSESVPHWLLDATTQRPSHCPVTVMPPYSMPLNIVSPLSPPYEKHIASFPYNGNVISQEYGSSIPISVVYPPPLATLAKSKYCSVNSPHRNMTAKDPVAHNFDHLKVHDHARFSKKRPASKNDMVQESVKKPNLGLQSDSSKKPETREKLEKGVRFKIGAPEITYASKTLEVGFQMPSKEKDSVIVSSVTSSSTSTQTRSGPVKLTPGAKHILKPSGTMDQGNSRTIHSTIPLTLGNCSEKSTV